MRKKKEKSANRGDDISSAELEAEMNIGNCRSKCNKLIQQSSDTLNTPKYELIQNMATLLNCACIIILQENEDHPINLM